MIRSLLFMSAFIVLSVHADAQIDSLLNSGKCISRARQLYDSGKYESAIKELKRIDPRDTNYVYTLSELTKAYYENKQYKEAADAAGQALKVASPYRVELFHSLALAHNRLGNAALAQSTLADGLKEFPFSFLLTYRSGIFFYFQDKFDEAEAEFFKTLDLSPFHLGANLYLSKIAMRRGDKVKGMMSMGIYLALNNKENSQLQVLESFVKNELTDEYSIPKGSSPNPFARLDELLKAKISFEEEYKTKIPIDIGIVKQYQLLFNQLKEQKITGNNAWINFYLTIYKDLITADSQEAFVYHILQSSPIKEAKTWAEKNDKALQKFYTAINTSLAQFRQKRTLPERWGYRNPVACTYYSDSHLQSIGDSDAGGNRTGKWYYYFSNGQEQAEGNYKEGKKTGLWTYFDDSGAMTSSENQETGEIKIFSAEGILKRHYFLKGKNIDGVYEMFHSCGTLFESRNYRDGKRDGPGKGYFPDGQQETQFVFKNDALDGKFTTWNNNGKIETETIYTSGKANGRYISYFNNGKVNTSGNYVNGEADGEWSYFYDNGSLKKKGAFKNNLYVGTWEIFNKLGELVEKIKYEPHDTYDVEDILYHANKPHYASRLKGDKVTGLIYYDKSGAVISSYENKEGTFTAKSLSPTGELQVDLEYRNGQRTGVWKYYSKYGVLEYLYHYKDGEMNGEYVSYFPSGVVKGRSNYKDGKLEGRYAEYYVNGNVKAMGWFVAGEKQQRWLNLTIDGGIELDAFYLNDIKRGYMLEYTQDKKLASKSEYNADGKIIAFTRYNDAGAIASTSVLTKDNRMVVTMKNKSGSVASTTEFMCGDTNGASNGFLGTGKPFKTVNLRAGKLNGSYTVYYPNGNMEGTGQVVMGQSTGNWKWFNVDGSKYSEGNYVDDEKDSVWSYYYYNGKPQTTAYFLKNEKEGQSTTFGLDGELVMYKKYEAGEIIAYKTIGKDGKFSDWKDFSGQGEILAHYTNGKIALSESYKNGKYDGPRKVYYPNGQLFSDFKNKNGMAEGDAFTYYPTGKLRESYHYKFDIPTGVFEYYDQSGNLYLREHYINGELNGDVEFFSAGKKTGTQKFFGGQPVD